MVYIIDILVRLYGLGWRSYSANGWNLFDVGGAVRVPVPPFASLFTHAASFPAPTAWTGKQCTLRAQHVAHRRPLYYEVITYTKLTGPEG